jgi:hypothetical protein
MMQGRPSEELREELGIECKNWAEALMIAMKSALLTGKMYPTCVVLSQIWIGEPVTRIPADW